MFSEKSIKLPKKFIKGVTLFALASILTSIGYLVIGYIDTLLLTYFVDLEQVGIYNTVLPTMLVLSFFTKTIQSVFFPLTAELWAKNLKKKLIDGIKLLEKYSLFVVIPVALTTLFFPKIILTVLFGEVYAQGALSMQLLSAGILFFTLATIYQSTLDGIGFPKEVTKIVFAAAILNIIGNVIFIPRYGIDGAAMTTTISYGFIMVLTFIRLRSKIGIKIHLMQLVKFVGAALVFILVIFLLKNLITLHPLLEAVILVTLGCAVYVGTSLLFKIITIQEVKKLVKTVLVKNPIQTSAD